jgi:hypothetical protein
MESQNANSGDELSSRLSELKIMSRNKNIKILGTSCGMQNGMSSQKGVRSREPSQIDAQKNRFAKTQYRRNRSTKDNSTILPSFSTKQGTTNFRCETTASNWQQPTQKHLRRSIFNGSGSALTKIESTIS